MQKNENISIPTSLYEELERLQKNSVFSDVNELVIAALQEFVDKKTSSPETNERDEAIIKERLKNLGYL